MTHPSQAAHTAEPWGHGPVFRIDTREATDRRALYLNDGNKRGKWRLRVDREKDGTFSREDAARIVACINACAGIQTAALTTPIAERLRAAFDAGRVQGMFETVAVKRGDPPDQTANEAFADFMALKGDV